MPQSLPKLPLHLAIGQERAQDLAADQAYGITQTAPGPGLRGFLIFGPPGNPPRFAPNRNLGEGVDDGRLALPPGVAHEVAQAGLILGDAVFEVAIGSFRGGAARWRLVDVVRADGQDLRGQPLTERAKRLHELRRRLEWRWKLLEAASVITDQGRASYLDQGAGRTSAKLAFRRLDAPYGEDWLVAPAGFRVKIPKMPLARFGQPPPGGWTN